MKLRFYLRRISLLTAFGLISVANSLFATVFGPPIEPTPPPIVRPPEPPVVLDNLLVNGSFEDGAAGLALTSLPGWTVLAGTVDVDDHPSRFPVQGNQYLDLTGSPGAGTIRQLIPTHPGSRYRFSGRISIHPGIDSDDTESVLGVVIGGLDAGRVIHHGSSAELSDEWSAFSLVFTATSSLTSLDLVDHTRLYDFGGVYLDYLSVVTTTDSPGSAVPDAGSTAAGLLIGVGGIAIFGRSRIPLSLL